MRRRAVLPYFPAGGAIAIVGSRGGAPSDPNWVHNLRANPDASVRIGRKLRRVHARIAEGDERVKLWAEISERAPVYRTYQERAKTREIPVVVLDEISRR
jgi:deazaflavin-dependent oxidoreductase (nitroreductase family)